MTDPSEMSKSLIKIQTLLIAKKATFIRDSDRTGTANEEVFLHNIGSIINGMKFRVMRKRYIFIVPIGKEEVTFELG